MYDIQHALLNGIDELEACCRQRVPRLLLADVALISMEEISRLDNLRRRFPATDWLLGWEQPSTKALTAAIRVQARGCVDWEASAEQFAQSLDEVLAGALGFPNPVLQALYLSVLQLAVTGGRPAAGAALPAVGLTAREDEVLSLMNRDLSNKQIAEQLGISVNTVKTHLAHAFAKQGQHSRRWHLARPGCAGSPPEIFIPHLEPAPSRHRVEKMAGAASDASYFKNLVRGQFQRISYHLNGETADNGLAHTAAPKSVSHLACYAGWPNVFSTVPVLKRVFGSGK
jgi:DNA-binding NarL/FixJ family response regulator